MRKKINKKELDSELKQAIEASKDDIDTEDKILQETLKKSMEGYFYDEEMPLNTSESKTVNEEKIIETPSQEEIRLKRLAFLSKLDSACASTSTKSDSKSTNVISDKTQQEQCNGYTETEVEKKENDGPTNNGEGSEEDMLKQAIAMSMEGQG